MSGTTVILGGGMSGLSAAYYLLERRTAQAIKLIEGGKRTGGWVRSRILPSGTIFEEGPRTVRPKGPAGLNTLSLVESLELTDKIIPIGSNHPAAKNRMIYAGGKLHKLPNSLSGLFSVNSPFDRPLIRYLLRDITAPSSRHDDESIYSFVQRRFGSEIADYLISPMICGICAGNAREISVNFLMRSLFEAEQRYGSIAKGALMNSLKNVVKAPKKAEITNPNSLGEIAAKEKWAIWSLKDGLEQFPKTLRNNVESRGASVVLDAKCEEIIFKDNQVELRVNGETEKCARVISSLAAKNLAKLVQNQHPQLAEELLGIPSVNVAVINLEFPGRVINEEAFGFLVPPRENLPILGVIFDSCIFPKKSSTVLTVMMGGAWFQSNFGEQPTEEHLLSVASHHVKSILNITQDPIAHNVVILKDCIPQHVVGHLRRLERIQNYITERKLPLALCGSSYQGVGLNDVILSAKEAVASLDDRHRT